MPFFETSDGTRLFYRDWGTGTPVVFVSSWAFSSPMWEYQMVPLSNQGLRCIAYDRRGHGRSDDPGSGYEFDTLAADLAALIEQLDLRNVTLVGHSMGCGEIVRYLTSHGGSRVTRIALISPITPFLLQTEDNPQGAPKAYLDAHLAEISVDRPHYMTSGVIKFFGLGSAWPGPEVLSSEMVQWAIRLILESSPQATIACRRATNETDFRPDLRVLKVPTLIIHGDNDQSAPLELCGRRTAQAIQGCQFKVYEDAAHGLFLTHKDRLNSDLLAFIQG
ncbi:MAG: alpha/beta hydrolase [Chloroflexota bacterium]|nr:alpha/beta hydrolase [Chloroflexota bacterium]